MQLCLTTSFPSHWCKIQFLQTGIFSGSEKQSTCKYIKLLDNFKEIVIKLKGDRQDFPCSPHMSPSSNEFQLVIDTESISFTGHWIACVSYLHAQVAKYCKEFFCTTVFTDYSFRGLRSVFLNAKHQVALHVQDFSSVAQSFGHLSGHSISPQEAWRRQQEQLTQTCWCSRCLLYHAWLMKSFVS